MLPIILASALGATMFSSNKSIAKKVEKKSDTSVPLPDKGKEPIAPIVEEPIIAEPIIKEPIVIDQPITTTPIKGISPITLDGITQDFLDAISGTTSTTKTGSIIIGELDKGSFGERVKKGSIYVAPLDKGEFVADPPRKKGTIYVAPLDKGEYVSDTPKRKGTIYVAPLDKGEYVQEAPKLKGTIFIPPLDKGSFDKPKRKGTVYVPPIENYGKWVDSQVVQGNLIMMPTTTITNPIKKSVKIIIEPLPVGEKDDWEARTAENPPTTNTGGGGGGDIFGGGGGYNSEGGGGGGGGWSTGWGGGLSSWLLGLNWGTTSGKTVTIDVSEGTYQGTMEQQ